MDIQDARDILRDSIEHVFETEHHDRTGSRMVYVFKDAVKSSLASGVANCNFDFLSYEFSCQNWNHFKEATQFAVPVDAPDEVLIYMAETVLSLADYPLLDEGRYNDYVHENVHDKINELFGEAMQTFEDEGYDVEEMSDVIEEEVEKFVFDNYEFYDEPGASHVVVDNVDQLMSNVRGMFG